jgi:hypothetical protein
VGSGLLCTVPLCARQSTRAVCIGRSGSWFRAVGIAGRRPVLVALLLRRFGAEIVDFVFRAPSGVVSLKRFDPDTTPKSHRPATVRASPSPREKFFLRILERSTTARSRSPSSDDAVPYRYEPPTSTIVQCLFFLLANLWNFTE